MFTDIAGEVAAIGAQDPRMPVALHRPGVPFRKLDSPLYRMALDRAARATQPRSYLEIGVKEGGSLAVVLAASARVERLVLCDFFMANAKKQAHRRAAEQVIADAGYEGAVEWLDGSSVATVPTITGGFDLVGVDGSHRRSIWAADLRNVLPLTNPGGHIVVDDLTLFEDHRLKDVFDTFAREHQAEVEVAYRNVSDWPGVGVLRRRG